MAQIQFYETSNAAGIKLSDKLTLAGKNLKLEFEWNYEATAWCDPKANCLEKFRAYFGQAAATAWNKATSELGTKVKARFEEIDKAMGKFLEDCEKYRVLNAKQAAEEESGKYEKELKEKLDKIIEAEIDEDFLEEAQKTAAKRIEKEGTKIKPVLKIIKKVLKVLLVLTATALAVAGAILAPGAGVPLLVAITAWMTLSTGALKRLVEGVKTMASLKDDFASYTTQMEKHLAELNTVFERTIKFANELESKADAMELAAGKVKTDFIDLQRALDGIDPKADGKAPQEAKELQKKLDETGKKFTALIKESGDSRQYAAPLRESYLAFKKVQNDQEWGTKLDKAKEAVSAVDAITSGLDGLVKMVKQADAL
jgi:ABC-type multidrug transport system fused ATPase/permease subunit